MSARPRGHPKGGSHETAVGLDDLVAAYGLRVEVSGGKHVKLYTPAGTLCGIWPRGRNPEADRRGALNVRSQVRRALAADAEKKKTPAR